MTLCLGTLFFLAPVIYMFSASLMPRKDVFSTPIRVFPSEIRWENYREIFSRFDLQIFLSNSLLVALSVIFLNLFFCTLTGYSLAKFQYPGRQFIFYFILATMMIPATVVVIPLYLIVLRLGWANTYWALIMPTAITPFGVFLMRQFILTIPDDYIDAARIDGCSEFRVFLKMILPLSKPALSALGIVVFIAEWNSFLWPLIVVSDRRYKTLALGLADFLGLYEQEWHLLMSASVVSVVPVLLVFLLFQKRFIEGMSGLSGLK